jgi:O-antigen/teichoic acid export membrane protein
MINSYVLPLLPISVRKMFERIKSSPLGYRLVHGTLWSILGAVVSRSLGLVAFVIVARALGKAGYGRFGIIQSTIGMFGVFAGFGLGQTSTKYVAELRDKDPERAGKIMAMAGLVAQISGILMAALLFVFAPWLASNSLAAPELTPLLRIGSFILIFEAINGSQIGALAGFEAFKITAKINMIVGLVNFPMMLLGVYWGGLTGSIWALGANRALNCLLNHISLKNEANRVGVPLLFKGSKSELKVLWHYSFPSMLSGLMVTPALWVCNAMIVNQPDGYNQMGIYQAVIIFQQILFFMGNSISAPLVPLLASRIGQKSERLDRINMLSTWALGALPAVIFLGVPELATILFGKGFAGRNFTNTFILIVFCSSVVIYKQGLARVLSAHGLMWWGALSNFSWAITLIVFTKLFIGMGAVGYGISLTCAYIINVLIFIPLYVYKGLVPKGTMISFEAHCIWMLLIIGISLNYFNINIYWRIGFVPISAITMCVMFWRLMVK